jgi:hypothetical protein
MILKKGILEHLYFVCESSLSRFPFPLYRHRTHNLVGLND